MPPTDPDELMLRIVRSARDGVDGDTDPDALPGGDVRTLARIGRALASAREDSPAGGAGMVAPPPDLWSGIAERLRPSDRLAGAEPPSGPVRGGTVVDLHAPHLPTPDPPTPDLPTPDLPLASAPTPHDSLSAPVIPLRPRRSAAAGRWSPRAVAGAAAAAIVAAVATVGLVGLSDDGPTVVAEVAMERLEGSGSGTARLERTDDGRLVVQLAPEGLPAESGAYYELWLIAPDVTRMVSLGPLNRSGRYEIPAGVDPGTYPIVDVSIEPTDGVPTHSSRSVLRGTLPV